jgi:lipopolysaccharide transport system permease protein
MLIIYTFVFSIVFKARWGGETFGGVGEFALLIFVGMIVQNFFAEVINRSPTLVLNNANYVKKVIFPIQIIPVIAVGAALFHAVISMIVFLFAMMIFNNGVGFNALYAPLIFLPFVFLTMGFSWLLSSLGVFLRDIGQTIGVITTILMFMSPVFYPISALPEKLQFWILLNPLTFIIEQLRDVLIFNRTPNLVSLVVYVAISIFSMWLGYAWFQKTKKGFSDVI